MTQRATNGPGESSLFVCRIICRSIVEASNQNSTRLQKAHSVGDVGLICHSGEEKTSLMKKLYDSRRACATTVMRSLDRLYKHEGRGNDDT